MITEIVEGACLPFRSVRILGHHELEGRADFLEMFLLFMAECARLYLAYECIAKPIREGYLLQRDDIGAALVTYMMLGGLLGAYASRSETLKPPPTDEI